MSDLLTEIEAFLTETGMGPHRFGYNAVHNSRLVERLRSGVTNKHKKPVELMPSTAAKVREFMRAERQRRKAEARGAARAGAAA